MINKHEVNYPDQNNKDTQLEDRMHDLDTNTEEITVMQNETDKSGGRNKQRKVMMKRAFQKMYRMILMNMTKRYEDMEMKLKRNTQFHKTERCRRFTRYISRE